jgi:hypothetical protein
MSLPLGRGVVAGGTLGTIMQYEPDTRGDEKKLNMKQVTEI